MKFRLFSELALNFSMLTSSDGQCSYADVSRYDVYHIHHLSLACKLDNIYQLPLTTKQC